MGIFLKKQRSKAAKIAGASLFALLMFVNLQITTNPNSNGDIDLFGINLSLFVPSIIASSGGGNDCLRCWWDYYRQDCTVIGGGAYCLFTCGRPAEIYCHYTP